MKESLALKTIHGDPSEVISPLRLLGCLLIVLFVVETLLTFTLPLFFHSTVDPVENYADPLLLALISAPFLWLVIVRPLRNATDAKATCATALLEHMVDGVVIFDDQGIIKLWNHAAEVMFGYSAQEVIGQHLHVLFFEPTDNCEHVLRLYGKLDSSYENCQFCHDDQGCRKDGSPFPMDISVSMVDLAGEVAFIGIIRDISERKRLEEVLRESEERFRLLVKHAPDAIFIQTNGSFSYVNQTCLTVLGAEDEGDLLGSPVLERIHPDSQENVRNRININIYERMSVPAVEEKYLRLDGTVVDVEVSAVPFDFQGQQGGLVFVRDITERKQAEEELQKKNAEIEQFIYTVSHDLRSPLVTVKTFMGYLEIDMGGNDQERITQDIQFIHSAADKMKLLLDELLEMSRIGRVETLPVRVSYMEVLAEVLDSLAGVINERMVDIHLPDTDQLLFGDRPRFCQIWQNLIENAIKYRRDNCDVRVELGIRQLGGDTIFFVRDNGIGIAPRYHGKIFGIFEKLNPKSPGAGLGLSMVQRIVEKCGGRVWVESEGTSTGSCFYFTLPHAVVQG
jgi:PAS domain S-box-containing protein